MKTKNGEHENVVKQLKQVQTLHQISQSCCERRTVKNPNHIKPGTCTTHGVCFLKLPKTLILKYTNFIGRNDFKFLQDRYLFTFHKSTIKDRPFVPAATVKSHMT